LALSLHVGAMQDSSQVSRADVVDSSPSSSDCDSDRFNDADTLRRQLQNPQVKNVQGKARKKHTMAFRTYFWR